MLKYIVCVILGFRLTVATDRKCDNAAVIINTHIIFQKLI
jgi:hypothetical protein